MEHEHEHQQRSPVRLSGVLVCGSEDEAAIVVRHLPLHISLTRAELGCASFDVQPTDDPMVWQVDEVFSTSGAFRAHQDRVAASVWGAVTAGIERRYTVEGLS